MTAILDPYPDEDTEKKTTEELLSGVYRDIAIRRALLARPQEMRAWRIKAVRALHGVQRELDV